MKITTCVPKQTKTLQEKFDFLNRVIDEHNPDIFLTPQEYFGGWQYEKIAVELDEFMPIIKKLSKDSNTAIITGGVIEGSPRRQILYFVDEGRIVGQIRKFAIPNYALDGYKVVAEETMVDRFQTFKVKGINVAGFFCWEVFSDLLMCGLGLLEPDLTVSAIKFGIAGYPTKEKTKDGERIAGVSYGGKHSSGDNNIWLERLHMASKFEVKCPIACSTNSWDVGAKYEPLAGIMYPYDKLRPLYADSTSNDVVVTEDIDFEHVRGLKEHKMSYLERCDKFPDFKYGTETMLMKIHRMESRMLGPTEQESLWKTMKKQRLHKKRLNKDFKFKK